MLMLTRTLLSFLAALVFAAQSARAHEHRAAEHRLDAHPAADLIVRNARIWTVDRAHPQAQALAVLGDRLVAVGTDADADAWRGPNTRVVDAHGRRVLPGFNDAHVHFVDGGDQLTRVQLTDAPTPAEFARRIAERAKALPKGEWVTGGDWDEQRWTPAALPTKELIDPATPDTLVWVNRHDGHESLANSVVLKLAGITKDTKDPPGGAIVHDANGNPTGVLRDAAQSLVGAVAPAMSHERRLRAARDALKHAATLGVTSVQDMATDPADIGVFAELAEKGELTSRVYAAPIETQWKDLARLGVRRAFGSAYLRIGAVKGFADGSLGSETAYFFDPYSDAPSSHGLLSDEMQPLDGMLERLQGADAAGLQLCVHAIGDRAISMILDLYEQIEKTNGPRDRRWRIEHSQHLAAKDFERYARLGVIASMQPYHAIDDGQWADKRIGADRSSRTYAFRTLLDRGVRLAFGTDWSVAPLDPMQGLYAAVTRATLDGKHPDGWVPAQKITLAEAVEAYTLGSSYAEFQERDKGSLAAGKLADFVVLDSDIFAVAPEKIRNAKVSATVVGGRVTFGAL
ncbi:MAG TPA: amidohydrolase [Rudaea sp.]